MNGTAIALSESVACIRMKENSLPIDKDPEVVRPIAATGIEAEQRVKRIRSRTPYIT